MAIGQKRTIGLIFDGLSIPPKDGVTYRAFHLIKALQKDSSLDIKVYIGDRAWVTPEKIISAGIKCTLFPARWLFRDLDKVASLLRQDKIELVHILNSHSIVPFYGFYLAQSINAKLVCDMHDIESELYKSMGMDKKAISLAAKIQSVVANACDHVFVMSSLDKKIMDKIVVDSNRLSHSPNGIHICEKKKAINNKNIIFIGNMYYPPNYDAANFIINVLAEKVLDKHKDAKFTIIGRTPLSIKTCNNAINLCGEVDDIGEYLIESSIGLAPLTSGSGMKVKVLTYASHGVPILGTQIAAMGYDYSDGIMVENNLSDFTTRLICELDDLENLRLKGLIAHQYAEQKFSWKNIVASIIDKYHSILEKPNLPREHSVELQGDSVFFNGDIFPLPIYMLEERFLAYDSYVDDVTCL